MQLRGPSIIDLLVTFCEFIGVYATISSFFLVTDAEMIGMNSNSGDNAVQENGMSTAVGMGMIMGAPLSLILVCCHRQHSYKGCCSCLCGCNSKRKWFYHPYYSATVQVVKFCVYAYNIGTMCIPDSGYKIKTGVGLASSIILASCDFILSINTIVEVFMETRSIAYPAPKTETKLVFISLWKDLGIISSYIRLDELYFLLAAAPIIILLTYGIRKLTKVDSQSPLFHLFRVVLIGAVIAVIYIIAAIRKNKVEYVAELIGPGILVGTEVIVAGAEMIESYQGRKAEGNAAHTTETKDANNKPEDKKDKVEPQQDVLPAAPSDVVPTMTG